MRRSLAAARAYTLPLVMLVLVTLAAAMTLMVFVLGASAKTTGAMIGRRESLYACDGLVRALMVKSRGYFATTATPTAAGLRDNLCGASTAPGCPPMAGWMPDYTVESVDAVTGTVDVVEEIPSGPFRGQIARRTDVDVSVVARRNSGTQRCRVTESAVNSQIGLFQFAVFSAIPMDLFNPPPMDIRGRVHINGDFCGSGDDLTIEKITASGRILVDGCPGFDTSSENFSIRDGDDPSTSIVISPANDGNEAGWRASALATWHGNALDQSHNVPVLRLPVATGAATQNGFDASGATLTNTGTLRLMLDPPAAGDSVDAAAERLANKADIRIINGVWYKRSGAPFPGTPIWSDHPNSYSPVNTDEATFVGAQTYPTSNAGPKRYSYYETDGGGLLANDVSVPSVVSYGALFSTTSLGKPDGSDNVVASAIGDDVGHLDGARTGFVDARMEQGLSGADTERAKILALNFDVGAFVDALKNGAGTGELGNVFPAGSFNGIIWIANTWSGWRSTPTGGLPERKGAGAKTTKLPLPLCGGSGVFKGSVNKEPCSSTLALPSAVRVWNAANLDPTVLPRGLTIATNGPLYTLGNVNTGSLNGSGNPDVPHLDNASKNWVPMLVAGDAVNVLSTAWSDNTKRWENAPISASCSGGDNASPTTLVTAVLGGHVQTSTTKWGGGINNFPRFLECWVSKTLTIHGSLVIGYRSVYQRQPFVDPNDPVPVYGAPVRAWKFDPNFAKPANQPPGSPSFFVQAIERWQRD